MPADRCPTCDREIADASTIGEGLCEVQASFDSKQRRAGGWNLTARKDCEITHRVDWRARAIAAESRIASVAAELSADLATAQAEIDRAVANPGGMGATLPSMSRLRHGATPTVRVWLGRLVERLRGDVALAPAATASGDPVLRAIAELLSCTYLDAVPTPADDERRRAMAVAAKVANDERRAKLGEGAVTYSEKRDAAKWRRVEPLIERLRVAADADTSDTIHVVDAAIELLAAAKEPS